jgi:hypothetical protein
VIDKQQIEKRQPVGRPRLDWSNGPPWSLRGHEPRRRPFGRLDDGPDKTSNAALRRTQRHVAFLTCWGQDIGEDSAGPVFLIATPNSRVESRWYTPHCNC